MRAIDYGVHNLDALEKAGYRIAALNDAEKAKLIYLAHHLGLTDTIRFIKGTITEAAAERLLIAQVGADKAGSIADDHRGSYIEGHRGWLLEFIDTYIDIGVFYCDERKRVNFQLKEKTESILRKVKKQD
ncbi:hypothetical protein JK232_11660 [Nissabacter archeti]|uniref:Uncharacterized protein n=1 Tax=Nissabacter archeti TaxID=1917880 RepID=A0ABS5JHY2_9GAMM|nr:hypothetical protein [Nissabacter archeti]MBS0969547.1 hypothetical protein [Nissabacter archeti]